MILSDDVLFVCPDTSFVQGVGTLKRPPGFPARPLPEPPDPLELPELLELLELPIPADPELELFAPPPIPLDVDDSALPPPPLLLLSVGPHAATEVTIHATREAEVVTVQGPSFE